MENLELENLEYETVEEFMANLKKEFRGGDEEVVKVVELRELEQGGRIIEEFVQEFRRATKGSEYEGRLLVEELKKRMSGVIRRKLIEAEKPPISIK